MLIVGGTRPKEKELGITQQTYQCTHCNNVLNYKIFRRRNWFTLFWIPVIPLGTKYFISCPICNYGSKIKKAEALEMTQEIV